MRWLASYARTFRPPDLRVPNMVPAGQPAPTFFGAYAQWAATPPPSWDDVFSSYVFSIATLGAFIALT